MAGIFSVETEGVEYTQVGIRGHAAASRHELKRLVEEGAQMGARMMQSAAPRETGALAARVGSSEARWHPGGTGGGGVWEAEFGVGDEPGPERDLPFWVYHGTGIYAEAHADRLAPHYGDFIDLLTGDIATSDMDQGVLRDFEQAVVRSNSGAGMTFEGRYGMKWKMPFVLGQRPQKQWVNFAYDSARDYVRFNLPGVVRNVGNL